jgi:hypothetical protein
MGSEIGKMLGNAVAVERVGFSEKSQKSGDRKCAGDSEKSFIELPDAKQFLRNRSERVFQQPQDLSTPSNLPPVNSDGTIVGKCDRPARWGAKDLFFVVRLVRIDGN